jgi:hypothetical protein
MLLLVGLLVMLCPTDSRAQGTTRLVEFSYSTSGDQTIVNGVAQRVIKVYQFLMVCTGANTITFKDSTPTTFTPAIPFAANEKMVLDASGTLPWWTTAVGKGFVMNLNASQPCTGRIWYAIGVPQP